MPNNPDLSPPIALFPQGRDTEEPDMLTDQETQAEALLTAFVAFSSQVAPRLNEEEAHTLDSLARRCFKLLFERLTAPRAAAPDTP